MWRIIHAIGESVKYLYKLILSKLLIISPASPLHKKRKLIVHIIPGNINSGHPPQKLIFHLKLPLRG